MTATIVELSPDRWRDYRDLRLEALRTDPQAFGTSLGENVRKPEEYWRGRLEDASGRLLFAESEGRLVGMLGAYRPEAQNGVELISLYVSPRSRGRGIAKQLMAAILEVLRKTGWTGPVNLAVNVGQVTAIALYRKYGFIPGEVREVRMGDGEVHRERSMSRAL